MQGNDVYQTVNKENRMDTSESDGATRQDGSQKIFDLSLENWIS